MDEVCSTAWSKICWNDGLRVMLWTDTRWSTRSFHSLNHSSKGLVSLHKAIQIPQSNEAIQNTFPKVKMFPMYRHRKTRLQVSQAVTNLLSIHKQREHLWKLAIVKSPKLQAFLHDRSSAVIQEHGHVLPPYPMKR